MTDLTQLYRHYDKDGRLLYVGISLNAVSRLSGHKRRSGWYKDIARVEIENHTTREEAEDAEVRAITEEHPLHNKAHNDYDPLILNTFIRFARNTNGFERPPVMRLCGALFELPAEMVDDIKKRFLEVLNRRGKDWAEAEARRNNIDFSIIYEKQKS